MSNLKGVVIDPGHGGKDSGAVNGKTYEKDLTLEISKAMYDELNSLDIPVLLTRDNDETLSPSERVNRVLSAFGNGDDVIVVSNHINAGGGEGAEVIYALRNNSEFANDILDNLVESGAVKRKTYQRVSTTSPNKDYYFMLRDTTNTEPVIVEYGFIDTDSDLNKIKNNYKEYAMDVVNAILKYKGIEIDYYIVKKGDTLYGISKKYNISVNKLKEINNLKSNILFIGQKLYVKDNIYIVNKGDTLYGIAKKYNMTVNDLVKKNNLKSYVLQIGQKIKV